MTDTVTDINRMVPKTIGIPPEHLATLETMAADETAKARQAGDYSTRLLATDLMRRAISQYIERNGSGHWTRRTKRTKRASKKRTNRTRKGR